MSEQDTGQIATLQRPTTNDQEEWKAYWKQQGQLWRTEPEVDAEQQKYLAERRATMPDIEKGTYPFGGIKLNRADVEWLLATHENGRGPVDWTDESQRGRKGLDLRGSDLSGKDLSGLPLARILGGILLERTQTIAGERADLAAICLEGADLSSAHLENASFFAANLKRVNLSDAHLEEAKLLVANLERAHFAGADLKKVMFGQANLGRAGITYTDLRGADLHRAYLQDATLYASKLGKANLSGAQLERTYLAAVTLHDENGVGPELVDIEWGNTNLTVADWSGVKMLGDEYLAKQTKSKKGQLEGLRVAIRANRQLAVTLQSQGLNEEATRFTYRALVLQRKLLLLEARYNRLGQLKAELKRLEKLLNEPVNSGRSGESWQKRMGRRRERLERTQKELDQINFQWHLADLWQRAQKFRQYLFSLFLAVTTGYGYRAWRSFASYVFVILVFATIYFLLGPRTGLPISYGDAIVFSMTSFHGRGFSPGENIGLSNPLTIFAAIEAFVGLVIEITFIATLTQRLFGK